MNIALIILFSFSVLGSCSIFLSLAMFSSLRTGCGQLLFFLALSDFGMYVSGAFTNATDTWCRIQAVCSNYFGLTTCTTSFFIARTIFILFYRGRKRNITQSIVNSSEMIAIWGIPALLSLVPAVVDAYGRDNSRHICWIRDDISSEKRVFMILVCFYIPLWITMVYDIAVYISVSGRISNTVYPERLCVSDTSLAIQTVVRQLIWFPVVILVCFFFPCVFRIASFFGYHRPWLSKLFYTGYCVGFCNAIVYHSLPNVRKKWKGFLFSILYSKDAPCDADVESSENISSRENVREFSLQTGDE